MVSVNDLQVIKPHIAVLPSPGIGHLIPLLEFAKRLVIHHSCHVSFLHITTESSAVESNLLHSSHLPADLHVVHLPPADVPNLISNAKPLSQISLICQESLKPLGAILTEMTTRPKVLVIDIFATQAFTICQELGIPVYTFLTTSMQSLALALYLPVLDQEVEGEYMNLSGPIRPPGCKPIKIDDLPDPMRNRYDDDEYKWFLLHMSRLRMAGGIFVNTWKHFESMSTWLNALEHDPFYVNVVPAPPIYPIGPLIKCDEAVSQSDMYVMSWLDKQPDESVLFVALGSGGVLTSEQLRELALGLELSEQRFVLTVRKPADGSDGVDLMAYLPEGFLRRIEGVGLVLSTWAPQVAVLRHKATGGFLSHCGWNSTLESIAHGVPMIAWPLYAEQKMNATMLVEEIGVAVKPAVREGEGVIGREEIERVVRVVMGGEEGKVVRSKVKELQESAEKALVCGGSSYESLAHVVELWRK